MHAPGRIGSVLFSLVIVVAVAGCARLGSRGGSQEEVGGGATSKIALGEPTPQQRHDTYVRLCSSCHGPEGRGDGPLAPELRVPPTDLTALADANGGTYPRALVRDSLTGRRLIRAHGPPEMPVWAERLDSGESPAAAAAGLYRARLLEALVDHVESLQSRR